MSEWLYKVEVKNGGSFVYDSIDVSRFFKRMAEERDDREVTVKPFERIKCLH